MKLRGLEVGGRRRRPVQQCGRTSMDWEIT